MDNQPQLQPIGDGRFSVSATKDGKNGAFVIEVTSEAHQWIHARGYGDEAVVEAAVHYLLARQGADELPTKMFLEDIDAAYPDFRAGIITWLEQNSAVGAEG